jgi:hypothetical protein
MGFCVLVAFLALGAGWIVERAVHGSHALGGGAIRGSQSGGGTATDGPAKSSDAVRPAATGEDYDRSDLLLIQG